MSARRVEIARPTLGEEEWQALRQPLESGWLTQGPLVAEFEQRFARRHDVAHAVAATSCTTGLHLALVALGIGPGDEVIVPAFTWVATANAVRYCGATPVFADVDEVTYNIDPTALQGLMTSRTRAIIPVHLFGLCADIDAVRDAVGSNVAMVEDAACAVGATIGGRLAGGLGEVAAFSFHPRKIITTGEGGMVTTSDAALAESLRMLRNHGASAPVDVRDDDAAFRLPEFPVLGFNYRMTDVQAAIGLVQLDRLDALLTERRRAAAFYEEQLADVRWLRLPQVPDGYEHSWQAYVTVVDEDLAPAPRNALMARLDHLGVSTRPGTHAVTDLEVYRSSAAMGSCPRSTRLEAQTMAIPLHNQMTEDDFAQVVDSIRSL